MDIVRGLDIGLASLFYGAVDKSNLNARGAENHSLLWQYERAQGSLCQYHPTATAAG